MGRGDAQATCLVLRIEASGAVTATNAEHSCAAVTQQQRSFTAHKELRASQSRAVDR
jgi:hypothetical protein